MKLYTKDTMEILEVRTELTIKNIDQFKLSMQSLMDSSQQSFILDLTQVNYLNSSALGIIANMAMNIRKNNKELVVAGINPPIDEIFEIVKFRTFMKLFSTLDEALMYFEQKFIV